MYGGGDITGLMIIIKEGDTQIMQLKWLRMLSGRD